MILRPPRSTSTDTLFPICDLRPSPDQSTGGNRLPMSAHGAHPKGSGMRLRSLLFVPGDQPERFEKAAASGTDAVILDLEDSVSPANKAKARTAVAAWLKESEGRLARFVRLNPLNSGLVDADLDAVIGAGADAFVLSKAEGAASVQALAAKLQGFQIPILPIATETPAAIFQLGSYVEVSDQLCCLTWGAEDLPAAIGAATSREEDGSYTPPYELVRALTLFGAHRSEEHTSELQSLMRISYAVFCLQ